MKKKRIKLINNEITKIRLKSAKACDAISTDTCEEEDNGNCYILAVDTCVKDYTGCSYQANDDCRYDYSTCSGPNTYDLCDIDIDGVNEQM